MDQETMLKTLVIGYLESRLGTSVAKQVSDVVLGEETAAEQSGSTLAAVSRVLESVRGRLDPEGEVAAVIETMLEDLEPSRAPAP